MNNSNLMAGQKNILPLLKGRNDKFLPIQRVHLSRKQAKITASWTKQAKLKASAGHIWPAGRMLCMPVLGGHYLEFVVVSSGLTVHFLIKFFV